MKIAWITNQMPKTKDSNLAIMSLANVKKARTFHESFPQYAPTPLANLRNMASYLGIRALGVKDESYRFGLNAFKVLGGSYAIARYIAQQTNQDISSLPYSVLISDQLRETFGQAVFFTATDGNHGRGVAWSANQLHQKAVVYMPAGTTQTRLAHILDEHANATIEQLNYDDCVRLAAKNAAMTEHGVVIQDTAWDGYEEIPSWIMQGYATMAMEAEEQFLAQHGTPPTHIIIQAGVGSLAGAVCGYFMNRYPECPPVVIVAESDQADCLYKSALVKDGSIRTVDGAMNTIMAGLACGEPNTLAWDILRNHASAFASCPDETAARGMRLLAAPLKDDVPVTSGESGAVTMGLLEAICTLPELREFKESIHLTDSSSVLLFSTEGDTDPERYRSIVWGGHQ